MRELLLDDPEPVTIRPPPEYCHPRSPAVALRHSILKHLCWRVKPRPCFRRSRFPPPPRRPTNRSHLQPIAERPRDDSPRFARLILLQDPSLTPCVSGCAISYLVGNGSRQHRPPLILSI